MAEETEIRVNFGKPMPLFPLASVTLLPHAILPLYVFEPRYRQMVSDALDGPGQIAMAVFDGPRWQQEYHGRPPIREAVCVGQIVRHQKLPDGCYNLALHGVCRARLIEEEPGSAERLYRTALLEPVGIDDSAEEALAEFRPRLADLLGAEPLSALRDSASVVQHLQNPELPTAAILEVVTCSLLHESGTGFYHELHYRLLAEGDAVRRARIVERALTELSTLLRRAQPQRHGTDAPKGCSWN